ncbi:MAG: hypothetical protein ABUS57_03175 [Pseudomonadota bacterium]
MGGCQLTLDHEGDTWRLTDARTDNVETFHLASRIAHSATFAADGNPYRPPPPNYGLELKVARAHLSILWTGRRTGVLFEGDRCTRP